MSLAFNASIIAGKLTDAQANAIRRGCISEEGQDTIYILAQRLMLFYREPTPNTTCYTFKLTEFGKLVQVALEARDARRAA